MASYVIDVNTRLAIRANKYSLDKYDNPYKISDEIRKNAREMKIECHILKQMCSYTES
jgi:hypothetical protein